MVFGAFLLTGCGSGGSSGGKPEAAKAPEAKAVPKVELKVAHTLANTEDTHLVTVDMAKRVAERTNGAFVIQVYPNAELGSNVDNLEQMMRGANIMSLMSPDFLATYVPDIGILDGPFLFNDYKDFKKIAASKWYGDVSAQMEKKGIKLLFHGLVLRVPPHRGEEGCENPGRPQRRPLPQRRFSRPRRHDGRHGALTPSR